MVVSLGKFDENFLRKIKDYKKIHLIPKRCICYTIYKGNQKVGIIGFQKEKSYFLKIGIHKDFRGKGIFKKALHY